MLRMATLIVINKMTPYERLVHLKLENCLKILRKYDWLLDSYVLDFYVDDHWNKLPTNWSNYLDNVPLEHLTALLDHNAVNNEGRPIHLWPLELLALKQLLHNLCIKRSKSENLDLPRKTLLDHPKLKHIFTKCVKPKKRHEIERMSSICARSFSETNVDFVVDFGAGLGHLARILGYGYGIKVCCLEMQVELNDQARSIDLYLEAIAAKHLDANERTYFRRPAHLTLKLCAETSVDDFISAIRNALQLRTLNFEFGIIGLHPCGDLGATLMRMFLNCKQAKFLNFVGCCYHKLSTPTTRPLAKIHGYPLSEYLKKSQVKSSLSYEAREISCHASEMYYERLAAGDYEHLKVHSFRAAAERIICEHLPNLKHSGLKSVKYSPGMSFADYFQKAVLNTPIEVLNNVHLNNAATVVDLLHWRRIVIFYTLRLMLAPLVESIVLYDRILFLLESDCQVDIEAIFDPRLSPRNHITSAFKS